MVLFSLLVLPFILPVITSLAQLGILLLVQKDFRRLQSTLVARAMMLTAVHDAKDDEDDDIERALLTQTPSLLITLIFSCYVDCYTVSQYFTNYHSASNTFSHKLKKCALFTVLSVSCH